MTTLEDDGLMEKRKAEDLIASTPAFDGVESVRVELGDNYSGEPSMWLVFKTAERTQSDEVWIRAFTEYTTKLSLKLIHSGLSRFPYTRSEPAS